MKINNPKLFQKFIDESIKLELDMLIDQFYLTNENGNVLSKTPLWSAYFRLLPNLPKYFRDSFLELCYADEWSPSNDEIIYISKPSANLASFLKTRPQILIDTFMPPIKAISSELIDTYNQRHNNTVGKSVKNTLSSGIFASMMGGKSEEYIASIYNNIGNFFQIGYAREIALLYTNVLLDKNGNAKYAVTFGVGQPTIIRCAHKRIFNNTPKWPLNTEYLAVTNIKELACKYSIEDFKKRIYREIKIFSGSVPWNDDCSIAIIDYNKNA